MVKFLAGVGTVAGGFVPSIWGGSTLSIAGLVCAVGGGIVGVALGARIARSI
jgi:hypothetical protein